MKKILYSANSNVGRIRSNNEDNIYCGGIIIEPDMQDTSYSFKGEVETPCIFALCDGMGGQEDGEFASYVGVQGIAELEKAVKDAKPEEIDGLVQAYVVKINDIICERMKEKSVRIGTTIVLVVITDDLIRPYNIGDSRIYNYSKGKLEQISEDHTLAVQKIKMGFITKEEAKTDRDRNKLTRCLGVFDTEMVMEAEVLPPIKTEKSHRIMLCSDGISDMIDDKRIEILLKSPIYNVSSLIVKAAVENGGKDNATCIIIESKKKISRLKRFISRR